MISHQSGHYPTLLVIPHPKASGCHQSFKAYFGMAAMPKVCNVLSHAIRHLTALSWMKLLERTMMCMHITHTSVLTSLKLSGHRSCTAFLLKCCQSSRLGARCAEDAQSTGRGSWHCPPPGCIMAWCCARVRTVGAGRRQVP